MQKLDFYVTLHNEIVGDSMIMGQLLIESNSFANIHLFYTFLHDSVLYLADFL